MVAYQTDLFPDTAADIIIIGSVVGRNISPFSAVYGATKFAVHALAEGLRREVGTKGIRVSLVEPGILLSGFQEAAGYSDTMVSTFTEKFGPLLIGEDIANTIHFMISQPPHVHISEIMGAANTAGLSLIVSYVFTSHFEKGGGLRWILLNKSPLPLFRQLNDYIISNKSAFYYRQTRSKHGK